MPNNNTKNEVLIGESDSTAGLEGFVLEDAKDELAELFFQCARYERNSMDWKDALNTFCNKALSAEREACARIVEMDKQAYSYRQAIADEIRERSNVKVRGCALLRSPSRLPGWASLDSPLLTQRKEAELFAAPPETGIFAVNGLIVERSA